MDATRYCEWKLKEIMRGCCGGAVDIGRPLGSDAEGCFGCFGYAMDAGHKYFINKKSFDIICRYAVTLYMVQGIPGKSRKSNPRPNLKGIALASAHNACNRIELHGHNYADNISSLGWHGSVASLNPVE